MSKDINYLPIASKTKRFPKIRGTILGVPIIKDYNIHFLYWGQRLLGNYHIVPMCTAPLDVTSAAPVKDVQRHTKKACS